MDTEQTEEECLLSLERLELREDMDDFETDRSCELRGESCDGERRKLQIVASNIQHNTNNAAILKLPREILAYILRWLVSDKLDVVALYNWSLVCKEFHSLSEDEILWHAVCQRIWGGQVNKRSCLTWKDLYLHRPHVHTHGVYVSRTTYVRAGDSASAFYKPYYYVEYFRILRFLPGGEILMLTTPEDPREVVHKLTTKTKKVQGLLFGNYSIHSEEAGKKGQTAVVTATLETCYVPKEVVSSRNARARRQAASAPKISNVYNLELQLLSTSSNRRFNKLVWLHHSCCTRYGDSPNVSTNIYDISRQYPALYFNQTRCFNALSQRPL